MTKRITLDQLHALLQEEFLGRAGDLCTACRLPRPVLFEAAREGPNWRLPALGECNSLCHTLAGEIAERYAQLYPRVNAP